MPPMELRKRMSRVLQQEIDNMSEEKITHKELLTFTNLTNLEWEYVDLKIIKEGSREGKGRESDNVNIFTQLNEPLTPEVFAVEDEEGNFEGYVYMKNVSDRDEIEGTQYGLYYRTECQNCKV